jgi:hypothetical protein
MVFPSLHVRSWHCRSCLDDLGAWIVFETAEANPAPVQPCPLVGQLQKKRAESIKVRSEPEVDWRSPGEWAANSAALRLGFLTGPLPATARKWAAERILSRSCVQRQSHTQ